MEENYAVSVQTVILGNPLEPGTLAAMVLMPRAPKLRATPCSRRLSPHFISHGHELRRNVQLA